MTDSIFRGLFDDASLFPPASLKMAAAVTGHVRHQAAWYGAMSGPFVCADTRLPQLSAAMTAASLAELDLALVLPGGASELSAATDAVFADPRLRLRALEVPISGPAEGEQADAALAVQRLAEALDGTPLAGATAFIEIPPGQFSDGALEVAASHRYLIKLRTGGVTAEAFPDEMTVASCLTALAELRLAFKCTAGLHHAVRHQAAETGFEHHGFLNVLLAVAVALDGASAAEVAEVLADQDPVRVATAVAGLGADTAADVRSMFTSFGTCSTDEPVADLVSLGLVSGE
jgi:hypothetical protein